MGWESSKHVSSERIWAAIRDERDLSLVHYLHVFNCPQCGKFLDICVHSPSLEEALKTFAGLDECEKAA